MTWQLDHAKAEDWLPTLADGSVDLVLVDPPYYKVKDEPWDKQWDTAAGFLAWLDSLAAEWRRVLKPNGSLYVFASPQMAARVEVLIAERFNVLNHITWRKHDGQGQGNGGHSKAEKEALRAYFGQSERIIFAEHQNAQGFIRTARLAAGLSAKDATGACGAFGLVNHGGAVSNWETGKNTPSREQYQRLQEVVTLPPYDDAIRPFAVSAAVPFTDVWDFPTVAFYPGKHPCEKPLPLLRHIISASSRPGALVVDCFAGSGNTGIAARQLGRDFAGCDASPVWSERGRRRVADAALQAALPLGAA